MAESLEEAEHLLAQAREATAAAQRAEVEAGKAYKDAKMAHERAYDAEMHAQNEVGWWRLQEWVARMDAWPVPGLVESVQWWRNDRLMQMRRGAQVVQAVAYYGPPTWLAARSSQFAHYYRGDGGKALCGNEGGCNKAGASMGKCAKCEKKLAKENL